MSPAGRLAVRGLSIPNGRVFDLALGEGECLGITGPSGSGKTLLLRAIADLDPHGGEVCLDGIPYRHIPPALWRQKVGFLPAESAWWGRTVGEHFACLPPCLEALGFSREAMGWSVERLSSGERQRLALARLLCNLPRVLLLDEPTAHLDGESARRVEAVVRTYLQEGGAALWVSHDGRQIGRMAHRRMAL
ncbi:MAG: ATP-binding cassette domain-containing protein [Gammaproteobacteria bacterium]|nr:MAG: ATP-binding cassette domain-containing protein [Gammaproteobacteria bacterium]